MLLHVHSEDSDQTGRIRVFARCTDHFVGFVMRHLNLKPDLGLHCLPRPVCPKTEVITVYKNAFLSDLLVIFLDHIISDLSWPYPDQLDDVFCVGVKAI